MRCEDSICGGVDEKEDPLFVCDSCRIAVHKYCYGIKGQPHTWRCAACCLNNHRPTCVICNTVRFYYQNNIQRDVGAFSLTEANITLAHTACAMVCTECGFVADYEFEGINGLPNFSEVGYNKQNHEFANIKDIPRSKLVDFVMKCRSYVSCDLQADHSQLLLQRHQRVRSDALAEGGPQQGSHIRPRLQSLPPRNQRLLRSMRVRFIDSFQLAESRNAPSPPIPTASGRNRISSSFPSNSPCLQRNAPQS